MAKWMAEGILKLLGWRVENQIPKDLHKYVVVVAPHTSGWDFFLGLLARAAIARDIRFLGKESLFKPPYGWILRTLGGYPVNRDTSQNLVDAVIQIFDRHDAFAIALAPEGTRRKVSKFKTGYYYIAKGAEVPIIMTRFDYGQRLVHFGAPYYPCDNSKDDLAHIWSHFRGIKGKNQEFGID